MKKLMTALAVFALLGMASADNSFTQVAKLFGENVDGWATSVNPSFVNTATYDSAMNAYLTATTGQTVTTPNDLVVYNDLETFTLDKWKLNIDSMYQSTDLAATTMIQAWTVYPASEITGSGHDTHVEYGSSLVSESAKIVTSYDGYIADKFDTNNLVLFNDVASLGTTVFSEEISINSEN